MKVNGIFIKDANQLIDILYDKSEIVENHPITESLSCIHYTDASQMKTLYCPDCGTRNKVSTYGGNRVLTLYELKDPLVKSNNLNGFIENHTNYKVICKKLCEMLRLNDYNICIGKYVYRLIATSDDDSTSQLLWLESLEERAKACERCYYPSNDKRLYDENGSNLGKNFILSTHKYGSFCKHILNIINTYGVSSSSSFHLDPELFLANSAIKTLSKLPIERFKIESYDHDCSF
jgi:hypothetical protein